MDYQQLVDTALWGYILPKDWWQDFTTRVKVTEDETASKRAAETTDLHELGRGGSALTKLEVDYRALDESDPLQRLVMIRQTTYLSRAKPMNQQLSQCSIVDRLWTKSALEVMTLRNVWRRFNGCWYA